MNFSQYTSPSEEWLALEATLPPPQADLPNEQLKVVNNTRCDFQDHTIPTRHGSTIEARSHRPVGAEKDQSLHIYCHLHRDTFPWIHDHVNEIGGDSETLAVGGTSAGACLAASITLAQHPGERGQLLMFLVLVHHDCHEPQLLKLRIINASSWVTNWDAPILPRRTMEFYTLLLGVRNKRRSGGNLRLYPGNATAEQVRGLSPVMLGLAGLDPLRDEVLLYAELLSRNG
ncbi:hypothetical protein ASPBRDRAFT_60048 [Aspergillus brasiliensis CBS 101740]|uniref:Alpha/beta hydrolase fold-3 domain-containing protein n=1 Tax=Aspergillus brasiliensis (strain CBS 101740 / IMI 381727 / IBT 21946) TaxID=767769 RepID=A0A1L9U2X2_ASPBC|nr:hypothetical protein ASPBRDRAFT_60048 [Aspergillus brasiliensis CBS 101740]